jgi:hypothetical protein
MNFLPFLNGMSKLFYGSVKLRIGQIVRIGPDCSSECEKYSENGAPRLAWPSWILRRFLESIMKNGFAWISKNTY